MANIQLTSFSFKGNVIVLIVVVVVVATAGKSYLSLLQSFIYDANCIFLEIDDIPYWVTLFYMIEAQNSHVHKGFHKLDLVNLSCILFPLIPVCKT